MSVQWVTWVVEARMRKERKFKPMLMTDGKYCAFNTRGNAVRFLASLPYRPSDEYRIRRYVLAADDGSN